MELESRFKQAAEDVKDLARKPDNKTLLRLYSLYKQATEGQPSGARPGMMEFVDRAKYDAWKNLGDMSREDAMEAYIDLVEQLADQSGR
ncbi:acyl-CoA-binding protein [bacterium]|nr:acyl-CoA-binding protein [candidate division CSSED10-310 bacterium]